MKTTQTALREGGKIRLHEVASNSLQDILPTQRSLGVVWDLTNDCFIFNVEVENKPFTRGGVLSMLNSIYDPLGFIAPITITGNIMLREATLQGVDWDAPLPSDHQMKWQEWRESLQNLEAIVIPRAFTSFSFSLAGKVSVSIFSDASEKAIAAVSYLNLSHVDGHSSSGFLLGKAKLAPSKEHSIPRLELCAAVLATEIAETISIQLDIPLDAMTFFTDSKVVLGYICNKTRRFYTYVSNRVERILNISTPKQWRYIHTDENPADIATRCAFILPDISNSIWIKGRLSSEHGQTIPDIQSSSETFNLLNPGEDCEIRPEINVKKTVETENISSRFEKFCTWQSLIRALTILKRACICLKSDDNTPMNDVALIRLTENFVISTIQKDVYGTEMKLLSRNEPILAGSSISSLSPFIDEHGILRVGGRISKAEISSNIKHLAITKKVTCSLIASEIFSRKSPASRKAHYRSYIKNQRFLGHWNKETCLKCNS